MNNNNNNNKMATNETLYSFSKKYAGKRLSPLKSIKAYCKDQCCAGDNISWKDCSFTACLLWKYRLGIGNKPKGLHRRLNFTKKQHPMGDMPASLNQVPGARETELETENKGIQETT